jgi:hypothetical protein
MQYSLCVRVGHSDPEERGGIAPYEVSRYGNGKLYPVLEEARHIRETRAL